METVADRLNRALELGGRRSIRSVQQELEKADIPGSSYPNVHGFFSGKATPSTEFLKAIAKELGVGPGWLAFGEPYEMVPEYAHPAVLEDLADDAAAHLLPSVEDRQLVRHSFLGAMRRLLWSLEAEPEPEQIRRLAELFVEVVRGPSRRLLLPADVRATTDHYVAMIHAVMLLFPPWRNVDSIETYISKLEEDDG